MSYEQYPSLDLLHTSNSNDGGISKLNSSLNSLDFYLLDDINSYLPAEKPKIDLINDNINTNSSCQLSDDFLFDFDLPELNQFDEISADIPFDDIDIEKWLSQASFPSPSINTNHSTDSSAWFNEQYPINADMIVPPSPPSSSLASPSSASSSSSSSPDPLLKRTKLTTTERKLRKKGQNKTAAEKYRIKKKSERTKLLDRHAKLKLANKELKSELENLTYRVQQIKQLFAEYM